MGKGIGFGMISSSAPPCTSVPTLRPLASQTRECSRRALRTGCARHIVSAWRAVASLMHMWHFTTFFSAVSPAPGVGAQVELSARAAAPCEAGTPRAGCRARRRLVRAGQHGPAGVFRAIIFSCIMHACTPEAVLGGRTAFEQPTRAKNTLNNFSFVRVFPRFSIDFSDAMRT